MYDDSKVKIFLSTESDLDNATIWECAGLESITAMATNGSTVAFVGYKSSSSKFYHFYTLASSPPYVTSIDSTGSYGYYIPAMTFLGNELVSAREASSVTQIYKGSTSSPFTTYLETTSSTSINVVSMAGYDTGTKTYLYTVLEDESSSSSAVNKKLYFNDDEYNPFDDVLFFSHWWGDFYER